MDIVKTLEGSFNDSHLDLAKAEEEQNLLCPFK